ncbi:MAG: hypothetical protein JWL61_4974 [Gemmatimonadetes bacterium]|nr:hypothetical protein [Gemmatimonadota bacterium]
MTHDPMTRADYALRNGPSAEALCAREGCGHSLKMHGPLSGECLAPDDGGQRCQCAGFDCVVVTVANGVTAGAPKKCPRCNKPLLDGQGMALSLDGMVHAACGKVGKAHGRLVEPTTAIPEDAGTPPTIPPCAAAASCYQRHGLAAIHEDSKGSRCIGCHRAVPPSDSGACAWCVAELKKLMANTDFVGRGLGDPDEHFPDCPFRERAETPPAPTDANYVQVVEGSFRAYPFDEAERGILARWAENIRNGKDGLRQTSDKLAHAADVLRYEATLASLSSSHAETAAELDAERAAHAETRRVLKELRHAGALLSNCAYNLAQRVGMTLDQVDGDALDHSRKAWDAAVASLSPTSGGKNE